MILSNSRAERTMIPADETFNNEMATTLVARGGAHHIRAWAMANPAAMLVHQSKVVAFRIQVRDSSAMEGVSRGVKALMLRDLL